jgi:hypothetical protein
MKVVEYPHTTTFPLALSRPSQFPNTSQFWNNIAKLGVHAHELNQFFPFLVGQEISRLAKEEWRLYDRHRRSFHASDYTLLAHP